ncbi:hypothetical protein EBZ70_02125 [bacterium]|nr:hypothetical protein [bacterium]
MQPRPKNIALRAALLAALAWFSPLKSAAASTVFQTDFTTDTYSQNPSVITRTGTTWCGAYNKASGTLSNTGYGLVLSGVSSSSAAINACGRITQTPIALANTNDYIELSGSFYVSGLQNIAIGLFNSGGVDPLATLLNNGLSTVGTAPGGGTFGWKGYRAMSLDISTTGNFAARPAQTGTAYASYELLSVGTGAYSSPAAVAVGTVTNSTASIGWKAETATTLYDFTYRITRSSATALGFNFVVSNAGTVVYSTTGTTSAAGALPSAITSSFDAVAFGGRVSAVPRFQMTALKVAASNSDIARITTQPAAQSLVPGSSSSMSVVAAGTGTLTYQWYKDGSAIAGATSSTYSIASASVADTGNYTVKVSNAYGSETSTVATVSLSAAAAPVFTTQPSTQSVDAGTSLTLVAAASGAPTPSYQWFFNNNPISGATAATYTVASVTTANAGSYKVVATNTQGNATSNTATVTVNTAAPSISAQPQPVTVNVGAAINLSVTASGIPTPTYQWYRDTGTGNQLIAGATSATYTIASATTADIGSYSVVVSNGIGSAATSTAAAVTVTVVPPAVTTNPVSATVVFGNSFTLTASYSGSLPRTYKWFKDNQEILGATSSSYTIASASVSDAGAYHVQVNNEANAPATSSDATITVAFANVSTPLATNFATSTLNDSTASITSTSTSWWILASRAVNTSTVVGDDPATVDVVETRPLTLKFPVTTGSSVVEAAARFSSTPVSLYAAGNYLRLTTTFSGKNLRVLGFGLYNSGGVNPFPLWGNPAADIIVAPPSSTAIAALGIGTQNWVGYRGSLQVDSSSATIGTRPPQTLATTNRGNELIMPPGSTGSAHNEPAGVSIGSVPSFANLVTFTDNTVYTLVYTITRSGTDQYTIDYKLFTGSTATGTPLYSSGATTTDAAALPSTTTNSFDAVAIGFRNLDSTIIPEMTVTSLKIDYGVAAAGAAPSFTAQPSAQTINPGATLTLTAAATGTPNPTYQWYKDNTAISGATAATYTVVAAATGDTGSYKVVATNAVGSTSSNTVSVTVGSPSTPYQTWVSGQGLTVGVNDGSTQDPDNDGVPNLVEFALGGNPLSATSAPAPVVARSGSNLTLTYDVKTAATAQFSVVAQTSSDLSSWTAAVNGTAGVTITTTPVDVNTNRVVVTVPMSGERLFARLRVTSAP